jgi:beta-N-acetylhexosaminidase
VDQEGGRVARLRPPHWPEHPAPAVFEGLDAAAAEANAAILGAACSDVGLDVVCAPCLDLRVPGAHSVIGDRAFSEDPAEIARLGAAWDPRAAAGRVHPGHQAHPRGMGGPRSTAMRACRG